MTVNNAMRIASRVAKTLALRPYSRPDFYSFFLKSKNKHVVNIPL